MRVVLLTLIVLLSCGSHAAARSALDHTQPAAPDGTRICAKWVHDRHSVEIGGRRHATWHPSYDRRRRCAFGHEHGTNPRAFRRFRRTGMPAFGPIGQAAGSDEPHAGFKVFATNDDRRGGAWLMVLHQGSGSPRRGAVRFHSLELWLFRRSGRLVAHTGQMADFGEPIANCPGAELQTSRRLLPHPACESVYEEWGTALDVGGVLRASPGFAIDNPITQFDPADPEAVTFNKPVACGPGDPAGWDSYCKGDKRTVLHPRWVVANDGPRWFTTDAYGQRDPGGPLRQYVSNRVRLDQSAACCGVENAFVMEHPSDGGLYRAGRGWHSANFESPGYCVLRAN